MADGQEATDNGAARRVPLWVLRLLVVAGACIFVGGLIIEALLVALAGFCFAASFCAVRRLQGFRGLGRAADLTAARSSPGRAASSRAVPRRRRSWSTSRSSPTPRSSLGQLPAGPTEPAPERTAFESSQPARPSSYLTSRLSGCEPRVSSLVIPHHLGQALSNAASSWWCEGKGTFPTRAKKGRPS